MLPNDFDGLVLIGSISKLLGSHQLSSSPLKRHDDTTATKPAWQWRQWHMQFTARSASGIGWDLRMALLVINHQHHSKHAHHLGPVRSMNQKQPQNSEISWWLDRSNMDTLTSLR